VLEPHSIHHRIKVHPVLNAFAFNPGSKSIHPQCDRILFSSEVRETGRRVFIRPSCTCISPQHDRIQSSLQVLETGSQGFGPESDVFRDLIRSTARQPVFVSRDSIVGLVNRLRGKMTLTRGRHFPYG